MNISSVPKIIPIKRENAVESWLNSKVDDKDMEKYNVNDYTIKPYNSQYEMSYYYMSDDTDVKADNTTLKEYYDCNKCDQLGSYNDHVFIYPNTNRYHANLLFRQLIDYSHSNNLNYELCDEITFEIDKLDIMDVSLKNSFYKFCYDNST